MNTGHTEVVDADLCGYFDSIPHAELMKSVARRVSDRHLLQLIKMWLEAPVEETDERGRTHRTTRNKDEGRGSPQGSPLSPLLANLYMRRFVLGWKALGHERRLDAHIVNYADDFVICCRGTADEAMGMMRKMMSKLRLTVNETKTRLCRVPKETFDFLGYTIGRCYSPRTGRAYIGTRPSAKKIANCRDEIRELTDRRWLWTDARGPSGETEPDAAGLGELLLSGTGQPGLPSHRPPRAAIGSASGFAGSTRCKSRGRHDSPTSTCTTIGPDSPDADDAELSVGEGVSSCPRAGCGKTARPVR